MEKHAERRKHKRCGVEEKAFVLMGPESSKAGEIVNISLGGIMYRETAEAASSEDANELDISANENRFYLGGVPFKTIYTMVFAAGPTSKPILTVMTGVQFGKLNPGQKSKLAAFMREYCTES